MTVGAAPIATSLGLLAVRPRTDDDGGLLRALFASSRRDELAVMGWGPEDQRSFVDLQLRAREQHRDTTRPDAELGIVTLDDLAVGQLDLDRSDGHIEVVEIALVPGLQGHGLGTALMGRVLAEADAAGLVVALNVEPDNPARRLYERLGFVVIGSVGPLHLAMERPVGGVAAGSPAPEPAPAQAQLAQAPGDVEPNPELVPTTIPTHDDLAPHVGASVRVGADGPDLELVAVDVRPRLGQAGPVPYSALFTGPLDQPLEQGVHDLDLPGHGPTALFIVPMAPRDGRALYELVVG